MFFYNLQTIVRSGRIHWAPVSVDSGDILNKYFNSIFQEIRWNVKVSFRGNTGTFIFRGTVKIPGRKGTSVVSETNRCRTYNEKSNYG